MEWIKKHPEKRIESKLKRKEKIKAYYRDWYAKNGRKRDKRKQHAHALVYAAVRNGRLTRPSECNQCPRTEKIEAHHDDYYKPLEVQWLCNRCHRKLHPGA